MSEDAYKVAIVSNLGSGQQLQIQKEAATEEEAKRLADLFTDISSRQIARVNLSTVDAKIETLDAQIKAHDETIRLIEEEINKAQNSARRSGSGKVYTLDQTQIENLKKTLFENTVKREQIKVQYELAKVELGRTKISAGVE